LGYRKLTTPFAPLNKPFIALYDTQFGTILQHEYSTRRHLGPFTKAQLEAVIGPFQTSLLSIIPKPNKPGKFRMVQDFSFPYSPSSPILSINAHIDSSLPLHMGHICHHGPLHGPAPARITSRGKG
jgi:hypothetical protein